MSTKIYQGFLIKSHNLADVLQLVKSVRPWAQAQAAEMFLTFEERVRNQHQAKFKADEEPKEPLSRFDIWTMWNNLQTEVKRTQRRNPLVDTEFKITVFPTEVGFVGITYTEHFSWYLHLLNQPQVCEYRYWNNSDPPIGGEESPGIAALPGYVAVTEESWSERSQIWDKALGESGVPAMEGFCIDITDPNGPSIW